jgi:hypothetical protein
MDTVGIGPSNAAGFFGFMNVYGDQPSTAGLDEGPINGDSISFTINGRLATVVAGDPTYTESAQKELVLSATAASVAMTVIEIPGDDAATFNRTVRFTVKVRNDGTGEDFYHISTSHSDTSFHSIVLDSFVYAQPGDTVSVEFEVRTPIFTSSPDTVDVISYTVNSGIDPSQTYSDNVNLYLSITDVPDGGNLPRGFALNQNYPNPFNPTTTISFTLPRSSDVRLEVFDILGRSVESRDLGYRSVGDHAVEYDASALSSGVYFYRLVTDYAQQSRKMLLVK